MKAAPDVAFAVSAKIAAIDGVPIENRPLREFNRRFLRTRSVTEMGAKPPDTEILSGAWWQPGDTAPAVCANEESAKILNLKPGDTIDWSIWNRSLRTRVACIERTESIRMSARFEFLFSPGQLAGLPAVYYGSAHVLPADVPNLQRVVYQKFPTVTVVNVADVMQIVDDVVERIALVIRFISAFTILAGAVMVASSVAGTRFRRMKEVVILKTLGASRRRHCLDFLGGIPGAGRGGGADGQPAGVGLCGPGAEAAAGNRIPPRLGRPCAYRGGGRAGSGAGRVGRQFSNPGAQATGNSAPGIGMLVPNEE